MVMCCSNGNCIFHIMPMSMESVWEEKQEKGLYLCGVALLSLPYRISNRYIRGAISIHHKRMWYSYVGTGRYMGIVLHIIIIVTVATMLVAVMICACVYHFSYKYLFRKRVWKRKTWTSECERVLYAHCVLYFFTQTTTIYVTVHMVNIRLGLAKFRQKAKPF